MILGARINRVPIRPVQDDSWQLDLDELFAAVIQRDTGAIMINSPNNPTGWMAEDEEQQAILDFAASAASGWSPTKSTIELSTTGLSAPSFIDKVTRRRQVSDYQQLFQVLGDDRLATWVGLRRQKR